ncbi:MAG: anthranilate synthase component I family protein [Nitrososphaerota archaeon]|nr:anthranilate synthase component I family protein [Nitrososphaerota archaeon]MDG6939948.1 anthranilate synthase component I family protein [Nitrososphaerota archaeon]
MTPLRAFLRLERDFDNAYLLESATEAGRLAEFSFIGFDPSATVRAEEGDVLFDGAMPDGSDPLREDDPLGTLRAAVRRTRPGGPRLVGGLVGYLSFEAAKYWEPDSPRFRRSGYPDMEFGLYEDGIVFDHRSGEAHYYTTGRDRTKDVRDLLLRSEEPTEMEAERLGPNMRQAEFEEAVLKAKDYVMSGDVFQAVLSKRHAVRVRGHLGSFYSRLSRMNPSPYMYYLKFGRRMIVGSSPEMLVRVEGNRVETFPIAGTRPRTGDQAEDARLAAELLADEKERAEHTMLVDLARNDVGKVATHGSVRVEEFMAVQRYSHVQHLVSKVTGELAPGHDTVDALGAIFPAGTVSGAPKLRATEIIEELEPCARGPYAGAVGYFSNNGNSDFAITIRTLVARGEEAYVQSGAGIVADSHPEKEWLETESKAAALLRCLEGEAP